MSEFIGNNSNFSVVPLAVGGFNTKTEYWLLEKHDLKPNITILQFFYDDFYNYNLWSEQKNQWIAIRFESYDYKFKKIIMKLAVNSRAFKALYWFKIKNDPCVSNIGLACFEKNKDKVEKYLLKIKEKSEENNEKLIILYVPNHDKNLTYNNELNIFAKDFITEFSKKETITLIDLSKEYEKEKVYQNKEPCPPEDVHPNDRGHEIAAEKIYKYLTNNNLITK